MKTISQANAFKNELDKVINTFSREWDLSIAEVLGVIRLIEFDLYSYMRDQRNLHEGDAWKE